MQNHLPGWAGHGVLGETILEEVFRSRPLTSGRWTKDLGQCLNRKRAGTLECAVSHRLCHQAGPPVEMISAPLRSSSGGHGASARVDPAAARGKRPKRPGPTIFIVALVLRNALTFAFSLLAGRSDLEVRVSNRRARVSSSVRARQAATPAHVPEGSKRCSGTSRSGGPGPERDSPTASRTEALRAPVAESLGVEPAASGSPYGCPESVGFVPGSGARG